MCPALGQDRLNFHQKPVRDTAGRTDPNWPNRQSVRYHVPSCLVLGGGAGGGEVSCCLGACWASGSESCSVYFAVCFVYSPYQYSCCRCLLPLLFC